MLSGSVGLTAMAVSLWFPCIRLTLTGRGEGGPGPAEPVTTPAPPRARTTRGTTACHPLTMEPNCAMPAEFEAEADPGRQAIQGGRSEIARKAAETRWAHR